MDEVNEISVNAETEANVEPQETEQAIETTESDNVEVTSTQENEKPIQDAETNRVYADMRRKIQAEAQEQSKKDIDKEYERLYSESHDIHTKADYDRIVAEQTRNEQIQAEAEKQGISEDLARRMADLEDVANTTKAEKAEYQRQLAQIKEHETLSKDEVFGDYYNEHLDEIKSSAENFKVDLNTAMLLSIKDNFKSIKEGATKKAQQDTINNIIKNGKTSPGSIASTQSAGTDDIANMSSEDFNKLTERVMRGEKIKL